MLFAARRQHRILYLIIYIRVTGSVRIFEFSLRWRVEIIVGELGCLVWCRILLEVEVLVACCHGVY